MAFSLDALSALILFLAGIAGWALAAKARISSRILLRFAAVLFAALAVAWVLGFAGVSDLAPAVAMLALSLGGAALALGLFAVLAKPLPPLVSALGLMLALAGGLSAALSGEPVYALGVAVVSALLVGATALGEILRRRGRSLLALGAMLAIPAGGFAFLDGAFAAALLFFAAGMIGAARASDAGVETQGERRHGAAISLG